MLIFQLGSIWHVPKLGEFQVNAMLDWTGKQYSILCGSHHFLFLVYNTENILVLKFRIVHNNLIGNRFHNWFWVFNTLLCMLQWLCFSSHMCIDGLHSMPNRFSLHQYLKRLSFIKSRDHSSIQLLSLCKLYCWHNLFSSFPQWFYFSHYFLHSFPPKKIPTSKLLSI